jgi:hypothetical protein
VKNKVQNILLIGMAPLILMAYGWYLGQMHKSGYDVAGILLFFTGMMGFLLALLLHWLTRKTGWHGRWWASLATGMVGCGLVFGLVLIYSRLHG